MATCSAGSVTITCGCGCYVICESDPPHRCWYGCEHCPIKIGEAVIESAASTAAEGVVGRGTKKLTRSSNVSLQSSGMSLAGLARAFDKIFEGEVFVPAGRMEKHVTVSVTAPLDKVVDKLGLALGPARARSRKPTGARK